MQVKDGGKSKCLAVMARIEVATTCKGNQHHFQRKLSPLPIQVFYYEKSERMIFLNKTKQKV